MPQKPPRERVTLQHPTGKFSVTVGAERAKLLRERGYRDTGAAKAVASGEPTYNRNDLNARARALGIPATGKNAELAEAIEAAEQSGTSRSTTIDDPDE